MPDITGRRVLADLRYGDAPAGFTRLGAHRLLQAAPGTDAAPIAVQKIYQEDPPPE
ncbi:MAG: hypothetical protein IPG66_05215 [Hydrogenophilales bacterium]|nr:hypothetical protein [Hydrogenophilales bacterium]